MRVRIRFFCSSVFFFDLYVEMTHLHLVNKVFFQRGVFILLLVLCGRYVFPYVFPFSLKWHLVLFVSNTFSIADAAQVAALPSFPLPSSFSFSSSLPSTSPPPSLLSSYSFTPPASLSWSFASFPQSSIMAQIKKEEEVGTEEKKAGMHDASSFSYHTLPLPSNPPSSFPFSPYPPLLSSRSHSTPSASSSSPSSTSHARGGAFPVSQPTTYEGKHSQRTAHAHSHAAESKGSELNDGEMAETAKLNTSSPSNTSNPLNASITTPSTSVSAERPKSPTIPASFWS